MKADDERTFRARHAKRGGDIGRDVLQFRAKPWALDRRAAAFGSGHHRLHHIGRDRKADADGAAGAREDGRVDADELALHVHQCAARVAGVDGGVGLDEELVIADAHPRAGQSRDDPARHRLSHAERVADGQHEITHLERIGVGECQRRQLLVGNLDLQDGKVGAFVGQQHLRLELTLVGKCHLDVGRVGDDMVVGDDQAIGINDHAGAQRTGDALTRAAEASALAEEAAKERVLHEGAAALVVHHLAL